MVRIRLIVALQIVAFFSIVWDDLRDIAFPGGASPTQALIVFILFVIWEDVSRLRFRLDE